MASKTYNSTNGLTSVSKYSRDECSGGKSSEVPTSCRGRNRLSLRGTAILERDNLPLLAATYHYWTDHADNFFNERVEDFQAIELSKVAFGVNGFTETNCRNRQKAMNDGSVYKSASVGVYQSNTERLSPNPHSDYLWTRGEDKEFRGSKDRITCYSFFVGFLTCMILCLGYYILVL